MKTQLMTFLLCATTFVPGRLRAATNDLSGLLQRGLFEEEANRDLNAAAQAYQAVSAQFDKDRNLAATAIFRLGEVYRKQSKTKEAVAQYERILHEFPDQNTLATLSRQNLAGLGVEQNPADNISPSAAASAGLSDQALLERLSQFSPDQLRRILPTLVPDELLNRLLSEYQTASASLAGLLVDRTPTHPEVVRQQATLKNLDAQIADRIGGILSALEVRAKLSTAAGGAARSQDTVTPVTTVADAEEAEIRRIQTMIQNSPDLINAAGMGANGNLTPLAHAAGVGWLRVARYLLDHGAAVQQGGAKSTPLHEAVKAGHRAMVELLLERGATIDARDGSGSTPLHLAAALGFLSVAEVLVLHKANLEAEDIQATGNRTPLERAAASGKTALVTFLAGKGAQFKGALALAVVGGHTETLQKLLELGAKPDAADAPDSTALINAAERGNLEATKLLLGAKANPNLGGRRTPLVLAAAGKHLEIAGLLLEAGADPDRPGVLPSQLSPPRQSNPRNFGIYFYTPLQVAISMEDLPMVKLLLANKADPNTKSLENSGWGSPVAPLTRWTLGSPEMLQAFLEAGADANAEEASGLSLLSRASWGDSAETIELLLAAGAKPDVLDPEGESPLVRAAERNCLRCVEALVKSRANPNLATRGNGTALRAAIEVDSTNIVAALLDAGADPNQPGNDGCTPVYAAVRRANQEVLALLLGHQADPNIRSPYGQTPLELAKTIPSNTPLIRMPSPGARPAPAPKPAKPEELAALLRRFGAIDDLPDFRSIGVSRASSGYRSTVYTLGTNHWNRFMLSELIAHELGLLSTKPEGDWQRTYGSATNRWNKNLIRFPDFSRITIHRPSLDAKRRTQIPVSFSASGAADGKRTDVDLQPGDVVEIPEADHPVSESWSGPTARELQAWTNTLARTITLVIAGQSTKLRLTSDVEIFAQSVPENIIIAPASFMLRSVLDESKLVRFSSDLTHVKVTRPKRGEDNQQSWVVDCSGKSPLPDLWLLDGDEIEVPDKP